jgi:hypothetical protein
MHHEEHVERCNNSTVATHILEGKVFDIIRETILNPLKLTQRVGDRAMVDDRRTKRLAELAQELETIEDERLVVARDFSANRLLGQDYIARNVALDERVEKVTREKDELKKEGRADDDLKMSIVHFCTSARAKFEMCSDFDSKRQFLVEHIERIIFDRYKVTVLGSLPMLRPEGGKVEFRIEGEISKAAVREAASRQAAEARRANQARAVASCM